MDSFDETFRKSQEAGERLRKALQKGKGDKSIQETMKKIEKTEQTLQQSKAEIGNIHTFLDYIKAAIEENVGNAVQSIETAVVPQADPNFKPHCISSSEFSKLLKESKSIVFITGRGICAGLGLPQYVRHQFNSSDSIEYDPSSEGEAISQALLLTAVCFSQNRKAGWKWISSYEQAIRKAAPTKTHILLNEVIEQLGREERKVSLVTENIDNFHQQVQQTSKKSRNTYQYSIYPMHGNVGEIKCVHCSINRKALQLEPYQSYAMILQMQSRLYCPCCEGPLTPHIMFHDDFYSQLFSHAESIEAASSQADAIVIVGCGNESELTNKIIQSALSEKKKVIQIGQECLIRKMNMLWVQALPADALEQVKIQLNS